MIPVMEMKKQSNICKFVQASSGASLITKNFVFEKSMEQRTGLPQYHCMYLVVSGKGRLRTEAVSAELHAGNLFFTFAQIPYSIESVEDMQYMYITFAGERSSELFSRFQITPHNCVFEGLEGISAFWQSALVKASEKNLDLISESVLFWTFGEMTAMEHPQKDSIVGNLLKYVEDHFPDHRLSLLSLSEELGYNSKYLSRVFKNAMGISFSQYLTNTRIQHAIFLMEQGVTAVKNVSLLCGFKDPFYFSNVFKAAVGISPSDFIKKQAQTAEKP